MCNRTKTIRSTGPLALAAVLLGVLTGPAADIYWTNSAGGNWSTAANWSSAAVPGSSDNAFIISDGSYTVTLDVNATVLNLTVGGSSGQQTLTTSTRTLTVNGTGSVSTNAVFNLSGGTLSGSGTMRIGGTLNWSAGALGEAVTIASNGLMNVSGSAIKNLQNVLTNAGRVIWTGSGRFNVANGNSAKGAVYIQSGGLFDIQSDFNIYGTYGTVYELINNSGTVRKSGGTGTTSIFVPFYNTGTVSVLSGTLSFNVGGTVEGTYNATNGTAILFAGGSFTNWNSTVISGPGAIQLTGGSLLLFSDVITNLAFMGGSVSLGPDFQGGTITNLALAGSTLSGDYTVSGVLTCSNGASGSLLVSAGGVMNWSGGWLMGTVTVTSEGVMNINGSAIKYLQNVLTNAGTVIWTGSGAINVYNNGSSYRGAVYNLPSALWDIQTDQNLIGLYGLELFNNAGTVRKSAGTGTAYIQIPFYNMGMVSALAGTLSFENGGTVEGIYSATNGTAILFTSGSFSNSNPAVVSGPGDIKLTGDGSLLLLNDQIPNLALTGGMVVLGTNFQGGVITNLTLVGSTLSGNHTVSGMLTCGGGASGSLLVLGGGVMNWIGGTLSGPVSVASEGMMNIGGNSATKALYNVLTNGGVVIMTGSGGISVLNDGSSYRGAIYNLAGGLWDIQTDQSLGYGFCFGDEQFNNLGSVRKSAGTGTAYIQIPFYNMGMVSALAGTLSFENGGTVEGIYSATNGTAILFTSGSFSNSNPAFVSGPGDIKLTGDGSLLLLNDQIPNLALTGGMVVLGTNFQGGVITNLTLVGSTLSGNHTVSGMLTCGGGASGSLLVLGGGVMNWTGGTLSGPVIIASDGEMNVSGSTSKTLNNVLTNAGTVVWTGSGSLAVQNNNGSLRGAIYNVAGGLWDIQTDQSLNCGFCYGYEQFGNAGTVRKSRGNGTTSIAVPFHNMGTVNVLAGTLSFGRGGTVEGIYSATNGAAILFAGGSFTNTSPVVVTGSGAFRFTGTGLTLMSDAIPGLEMAGGTVVLGPGFQGGTITDLVLVGSVLSGNHTVSGMLTCGGGASGSLLVLGGGAMNWMGGTLAGTVTITSDAQMNISGSGDRYLQNVLTNAGVVNWTANGVIRVFNDGSNTRGAIYNLAGGLWDIQTDQSLGCYVNCSGLEAFNNAGTVRKSGGTGTASISIPFFNAGTVSVVQGTLSFIKGGTVEGNYSASSGTAIAFGGGAFSYITAPVLNGPGAIRLTGGSLTLVSDVVPGLDMAGGSIILGPSFQGGTITNLALAGSTLSGDHTVSGTLTCSNGASGSLLLLTGAVMNMSGGTFGASGTMTVEGVLNWTGGTLAGPVTVASDGVMNISGSSTKILQNVMTNAGVVVWTGNGYIYVVNNGTSARGAIFNVTDGLWDIQTDRSLSCTVSCNGLEVFNNAGTVRKSAGTGSTTISISFFNTGTVIVDSGTLFLNGGGVSTGSITVALGAAVSFGGTFANIGAYDNLGGTVLGPETGTTGVVVIASGIVVATNAPVLIGPVGVGLMTISGGDVTFGQVKLGGTMGATNASGELDLLPGGHLKVLSSVSANLIVVAGGDLDGSGGTIIIGEDHDADMEVSAGSAMNVGSMFVGYSRGFTGNFTQSGGTVCVTNELIVGVSNSTGVVAFSGGELYVTNDAHTATLDVRRGNFLMSGGKLVVDRLIATDPGAGTFSTTGGTLICGGGICAMTNLVLNSGSCFGLGTGSLGGSSALYVTNATHTAVLNVIDGKFLLSTGGTLVVDRLIITNANGHFFKTGGTLEASSTILSPGLDADSDGQSNTNELRAGTDPLDPNSLFQTRSSTTTNGLDIRVEWTTEGGHSYVVQWAANLTGKAGDFTDLSPAIFEGGTGPGTTNYVHVGAATNQAGFYRVRLGP